MNTRLGIVLFSAIETATVIAWFALLPSAPVTAAIVLFVGYVIEHVIALNVGKGRPFFDIP